MESYLKEEYDVYESKYLKDESEIEDYFMDSGVDFFDCGQGYYQDEVDLIVKIEDKFFRVDIYAEIMSAKQDVGDRLYWVDGINEVEYKEIPKPLPKDRVDVTYNLTMTHSQKNRLEEFMKDNFIEIDSDEEGWFERNWKSCKTKFKTK